MRYPAYFALIAVCAATSATAQHVNRISPFTGIYSVAACNPAANNSGRPRGAEASCSSYQGVDSGARARAATNLGRLKAEVLVLETGEPATGSARYAASSQVQDGFYVNPVETRYLDQPGTISFSYDLDGVMSEHQGNELFFGMDEIFARGFNDFSGRRGLGSYGLSVYNLDGDLIDNITSTTSRITVGSIGQSVNIQGSAIFSFDIIFGNTFEYHVFLSTSAIRPGATVDFFNTMNLNNIIARDSAGNVVDLQIASVIGLDYAPFIVGNGVSGIPEPASWAMLIAGFGFVGGAARRIKLRQVTTT